MMSFWAVQPAIWSVQYFDILGLWSGLSWENLAALGSRGASGAPGFLFHLLGRLKFLFQAKGGGIEFVF